MVINFQVSTTSITENFTAKAYEVNIDGTEAEVSSLPIPGPHTAIFNGSFTGLDRISHVIRITGDSTMTLYAFYDKLPVADIVNVPPYIQFVVGDGAPYSPAPGANGYINPILQGLLPTDYIVYKPGVGYLKDGVDIANNMGSGGFNFLGGEIFVAGQIWTIQRKIEVIQTVVNDSVVGKRWGPTIANPDMFVDVTSQVDYIPAHLRKLIRLAGPNAEYRFTNASVPGIGYDFTITNYGSYTGSVPFGLIRFMNAPLKYGNTTITTQILKFGSVVGVVWDGTIWNLTTPLPTSSNVPSFYKGTVNVGDVPAGDANILVPIPNQGGSDWGLAGCFVSNGNPVDDDNLTWAIKDPTNSSFRLIIQEIGGATQNVEFRFTIIN